MSQQHVSQFKSIWFRNARFVLDFSDFFLPHFLGAIWKNYKSLVPSSGGGNGATYEKGRLMDQ